MEYFKSHDGLKLAYRDEGSGPPVVCLAGLTRHSADFDYLVPYLPGYRIIRPDYRGRGQSDWDSMPVNYNPVTEARDVMTLMELLGIESACFIGTSRGGIITIILASMARHLVSGFILNDIGPRVEMAGLERIAGYVGRKPVARTLEEAADNKPGNMPGFANVSGERWLEEARHTLIQSGTGLDLMYDPRLRDNFMAYLEGDPVEFWDEFAILAGLPGAVIRGANSDLLSEATVKKMVDTMPGLHAIDVPDRGHCPFLDEQESIATILMILNQVYD